MEKWQLIGSTGSLESMIKMLNKEHYSTSFRAEKKGENIYDVFNAKGKIQDVRIIEKKGRFRYEYLKVEKINGIQEHTAQLNLF